MTHHEEHDSRRVTFEEDALHHHHRRGRLRITEWVVKNSKDFIKHEKHAANVILLVLVLLIAASAILYYGTQTHVERGGQGPSVEETNYYHTIQPF